MRAEGGLPEPCQVLAAGFGAVAVSLLLHVKPQMLFSSTFACSPLVRNTGSFVYRKAGSVKVLVNSTLPSRPRRALPSLGKDLTSVASFPLAAILPSPPALALLPTWALKAVTTLKQPS